MPLLHLAILAIVQGITEFLPISSSGHLVLVPELTGWADQGPVIDVAVHVGTLVAVMAYFWRDIVELLIGTADLIRLRWSHRGRLVAMLAAATVPVAVGGFLLSRSGMQGALRSAEVIGWTTLGFGLLLYLFDTRMATRRRFDELGFRDALLVGLAQVLALIPGTSRAGITITAARGLEIERQAAARFSMLLSIPTIIAAGTLQAYDVYRAGEWALGVDAMVAAVLAMATAFAAIAAMMAWLKRASFTPFVIYRTVLGLGLLAWVYL